MQVHRPGERSFGPGVFQRIIIGRGPPGLLLILLFGGCALEESSSPDVPTFIQTDSASVALSVTKGFPSSLGLPWSVDSIPDFELGREGSTSDIFFRIQGLRGLPDGGLLAVDGGSRQLRYFDSLGHLITVAGGRGEGPGEFEDPVLVPKMGSDSLLFFDKRLPRLQLYAQTGRFLEAFRYRSGWPSGRVPPVGSVGLNMLYRSQEWVGGSSAAREEGLLRTKRDYFWYDSETGENTTVESFILDLSYNSPRMSVVIPFTSLPSAAVGWEEAFLTRGRDHEIRAFEPSGRLTRVFRVDADKRPVTPEMIRTKVELQVQAMPRSTEQFWQELYAEVPIPDTLPAFQALLMDDTGWLWAQRYHWDPSQPKEWIVIDPDGRAHGTVETPPGLDVKWIGEDRILGVWLDDMGVEYVRQHALHRTVPEPSTEAAGERGQGRAESSGGHPIGGPGEGE